ncbi:MAG TPA: glycoside hydrolase N-terminal domain-containing protein [Pedobacter sp.]|uniref:glycosyl hydrolase family 95 catalytic domain-containing protein n=1 Tax=Pedobacter sp. TaxID=1411316 RepID=UPI002BB3BB3D|nr:glycoside hydrolase N-terminal domain-containing protein [Pedobacter sp.]HMI02818.1 glycoside hydrolase N-terminal domain-containing protein [Pedobacter sp.]
MKRFNRFKFIVAIATACVVSIGMSSFHSDEEKGLSFNENNILEADHIPDLDLSEEVSLEAWIKINEGQYENTRIIDKYQSSGSGGFLLGVGKNNKLWMVAGTEQISSKSETLPLGKWIHIAGVFSRSKGIFKLYMDGKEIAMISRPGLRAIRHTSYPLRIGADAQGQNYFHGDMNRIAIYNRALTGTEIEKLKERTLKRSPFLPVTEWDLNSNSGNYRSTSPNRLELGFLHPVLGIKSMAINNSTLWYKAPASQWTEALPIGNGRFGAMIFGKPERERFQLNDITVWSGDPQPDADRKGAYLHLDTIRKAIRQGMYKEAQQLTSTHFTSSAPYNASYQTLGDLSLQFSLPKGVITDYYRWLDIDKALAGVSFKAGAVSYARETFSSAADGVMMQHLTSSKKAGLTFNVNLTRLERAQTRFVAPNKLIMIGNTGNTLAYEIQLTVINKGGMIKGDRDRLLVENADEVTLLVTAGTSYILDYALRFKGQNPHNAVTKHTEVALSKSYAQLKEAHIRDYQKYFRRVNFDLGDADAIQKPTDQRLKTYHDGTKDPAFVALFYQYGRYLLISSSRPDNPLPSNSQGIWGDGLDLPWKCDYKSNINYEMNYWQAEQTNLSELHLPMIRMTQALKESGIKTAKAYYGPETPGWFYGYTTNPWGWTSPGAALPWGVFSGSSGWVCQHLWEHYAFGRDKAYLKSIYPTLKGAAEFYMATMIEDKSGYLVTSPSTSPENNFTTNSGIKSNVTEGATMERAIVWDLFNNVIHSCAELNLDIDFQQKVIKARNQIRPLQIGRAGQLMEWNEDWDLNSDDMGHRHVSHLFPLYPGHQITALGTPKLAAAAKKSLELRGDDGTGWSIAWKENFWAMLRNGDHVHKLLSYQLRYTNDTKTVMANAGGTYANLFDAHPPFQIDGNFGAVSGITGTLLQSSESYQTTQKSEIDAYVLDILPALPAAWPNGSITGLKARGGFEVSINWKNGRLTNAKIKSLSGEVCKIRASVPFHITGQNTKTVKENGNYILALDSEENVTYELSSL